MFWKTSARKFGVCSLTFLAVFFGGSGIAHAGRSSSMAATCTAGDPAIQGNLYTIASGSVRHQDGKTGTITLYCPIAPTITEGGGSFGGWFMTFADPDGDGRNYYIESQILRCDQSGHVTPVSDVLSSGGSTGYIERALRHTYDFKNFYYYVRVNIFRGDTKNLPIFYGVGVDSLPDH
jgi:hypothetical protein